MTMRKLMRAVSMALVVSVVVSSSLFSQEKNYDERLNDSTQKADGTYSSKSLDESDRPDDSYIAKFHATQVVDRLMKENLDKVYLLKVIVSNYKEKGWESDYNKAYEGYKLAMELYYRRNIIYSRREFENNKKLIDDMLKRISEEYRKDTEAMLRECASQVMALHLDEQTRSDPNKVEDLFTNQVRLRIAYGQFDDGMNSYLSHNNVSSIQHYRVSKNYAIKILEELSEDPKATRDKYRVHIADNLNRVLAKQSSSKPQGGGGGGQTQPK